MRLYEDRAYGPDPIADSYWPRTVASVTCPGQEGATTCDTAIIGAGFTGLNAALELAAAGQNVVILEAQQPGFGASGRNGGFCCLGGSALDPQQVIKAFGAEQARDYFQAEHRAVDFVRQRLDTFEIEADTHSNGETLLAHSPGMARRFPEKIEETKALYGVTPKFIPKEALREHGFSSPALFGALTTPIGFALNPMKYVLGLVRAAMGTGVRIYGDSPVTALSHAADGSHLLKTAHGEVRARNLIVATNGYSAENLPRWLSGRYLPVQSAILLTEPMTNDDLSSQGWTSRQMCYDSRHLLHYFRLLPDNRMLFGMRASNRWTPSSNARAKRRTRADFERMFPAWEHVKTVHFWSGLVCASRNRTPYAGPVPGMDRTWTALCYHGNGVAMGSYSGAMIAAQILNRLPHTPHLMTVPLRKFEVGRWRRNLLPLIFAWYSLADRTS